MFASAFKVENKYGNRNAKNVFFCALEVIGIHIRSLSDNCVDLGLLKNMEKRIIWIRSYFLQSESFFWQKKRIFHWHSFMWICWLETLWLYHWKRLWLDRNHQCDICEAMKLLVFGSTYTTIHNTKTRHTAYHTFFSITISVSIAQSQQMKNFLLGKWISIDFHWIYIFTYWFETFFFGFYLNDEER